MRPKTGDVSFVWDMLDAALAVRQFVAGKRFDDYTNDRLLRGAVERHIEIIGEAAGASLSLTVMLILRSPGAKSLLSAMFWPTSMARSGTTASG